MRTVLFVSSFLLTSCAAQEFGSYQLPGDVRSFVERREMCDYFRGEVPDPDDARRMEAVEMEISRYCFSTDQDLASLKAKYANRGDVMAKLDGYAERIEADR